MSSLVNYEKLFQLWKELTESGKHVKIGGVLGNYEIVGPNLVKLVFDRARFICKKPKRKHAKKDFGHLILTMPQQKVSKQQFQDMVKNFKANKLTTDNDLVAEIMKRFKVKGDKVDLVKMHEAYMKLYPDTRLPRLKIKKGRMKNGRMRKGKGKKGKRVEQAIISKDVEPKEEVTVIEKSK